MIWLMRGIHALLLVFFFFCIFLVIDSLFHADYIRGIFFMALMYWLKPIGKERA